MTSGNKYINLEGITVFGDGQQTDVPVLMPERRLDLEAGISGILVIIPVKPTDEILTFSLPETENIEAYDISVLKVGESQKTPIIDNVSFCSNFTNILLHSSR